MSARRRILLAAAAAALGGCAAPVVPVANLPAVVGRHEWRPEDGRLNVAATLANGGSAPARVRVDCQFAGPGGLPAGPVQSQTIVLGPGETGTVHFAAADPAAGGEAISVRSAAAAR